MLNHANDKNRMLQLQKGGYVYVDDLPSGMAKKLRNHYSGPYNVDKVTSSHTVILVNPSRMKTFTEPIHIDRIINNIGSRVRVFEFLRSCD